jgi:hypothetical protein
MKKKVLLILACMWIIISFLVIKSTYAKYLSKLDADTNVNIASWKIRLNNQDIISNSDFSQNLELIFPGTNYANANVVVPRANGYFDLTVDASEVNLKFKYSVTCTLPSGNEIADMKISGYALEGNYNNIITVNSSLTAVEREVPASATSSTMRVFVQWEDGAGTVLDDDDDTAIALQAKKARVQANVHFEQLR